MIILNVFFTLVVLYFIIYIICSYRAYTKLCLLTDSLIQGEEDIYDYRMFVCSFVFWSWNLWADKSKYIKIFILPFSMLKIISKIKKEIPMIMIKD